jgi:hypothetical protein
MNVRVIPWRFFVNLIAWTRVIPMGPIWSLALPLLLGAAQEELPANWKVNVSKDGGFSVAMPGTPTETKKQVKTATGQLLVTMLVAEGRDEALFVVSFSDFPKIEVKKETVDKRLDNARDGAVSSARGKLRTEKIIKLDETHPGRELVVEKDGAVVAKIRIYVVKNRLYQVMVLCSGAGSSKEAGVFMDSFRLNK